MRGYRPPVRRRFHVAIANVVTLVVIVSATVGGALLSARRSHTER